MKRVVTGLMIGCLMGAAYGESSSQPDSESRVYPRSDSQTIESHDGDSDGGGEEFGITVLMKQIHEMEEDLQRLQGEVEELRHELDADRKADRARYVDLDSRISSMLAEQDTDEMDGDDSEEENASESDREAYTAARELLLAKDFEGAKSEFKKYIEDHPDGQFQPYAHFWLGEIYRSQDEADLSAAKTEFQTVVDDFPEHSQVAAALYKLSGIHAQNGDSEEAKTTLEKIQKDFPDSSEARLAERMLDQL